MRNLYQKLAQTHEILKKSVITQNHEQSSEKKRFLLEIVSKKSK